MVKGHWFWNQMDEEEQLEEVQVSVVVCTYKRTGLLIKAILSLLDQDYTNYEIAVIDNDPQSENESLVSKLYPASKHRIEYATEGNQGLSFARNRRSKSLRGT